jgi:hypothetical protein
MVGVGASPSAAGATGKFTTIASGFDNPRGLAFGEDGQLYVGEAGKGGPKCVPGGPEGPICPGLTSAISVITKGRKHHRIVSGLASLSSPGGFGATGVDGISFNNDSGLYGIITSCPQQVAGLVASQPPNTFDPALVEEFKDQVGQEIKVTGPGKFKTIAPVGKVDWQWTVDHQNLAPNDFPDCNPYAILADEHGQWVIDAASNTIDHITGDAVHVEKFVPNPPPRTGDAVPTCIARGRDGAFYISELMSAGNPAGSSIVWRFDPKTEDLDQWATGLTAVTGCGFGPDGAFYATEFSQHPFEQGGPFTGAVVRVPRGSTSPVVVADGLSFPNGFAASEDAIYVSNWSISVAHPTTPPPHAPPGTPPPPPGSVVKISVPHADDD